MRAVRTLRTGPRRPSSIASRNLVIPAALLLAAGCAGSAQEPSRTPAASPAAAPAEKAKATAPERDTAAAIAERHAKRDEFYRKMQISPFTSLGVFPIPAHRPIRVGADDAAIEVDPNTRKPIVISILVDATGPYVTTVSGGEKIRLRRLTRSGDAVPGDGVPLSGLKRIDPGEAIGMSRFIVDVSGHESGGQISLYDPDSPAHRAFTGFKWFDADPNFQIRSVLQPIASPDRLSVATSDGQRRDYYRFGTFEFTVDGKPQKLTALAPAPAISPGTTLFLPFRDETNGRETYANGRYLEIPYEGPGLPHLLDFNRTINPYCNYSPWYSCPIPPKENTLTVSIQAGEKAYPHEP